MKLKVTFKKWTDGQPCNISVAETTTTFNNNMSNATAAPTPAPAGPPAADIGAADVDAFWLVINAQGVFLMQTGFMLLEVGSVRASHAK